MPSNLKNNPISSYTANFTGVANFTNPTHLLKSFERSFADFLPLIPTGREIKVGIIDYIIKIVGGGALIFGLLAIALRRKFERKIYSLTFLFAYSEDHEEGAAVRTIIVKNTRGQCCNRITQKERLQDSQRWAKTITVLYISK